VYCLSCEAQPNFEGSVLHTSDFAPVAEYL
jgi:hypothetical protein